MELHSKDTLHNRTKYKAFLIVEAAPLGPIGITAEGIINLSGACRATVYRHLRRWTTRCHYLTRKKWGYRWCYRITPKGHDFLIKTWLKGYPVNVWRAEINEWNRKKRGYIRTLLWV